MNMNTDQKNENEKKLFTFSLVVTAALISIVFYFLVDGIFSNQGMSAIMIDTVPALALALVMTANIIRLKRKIKN